jgi:citrate lyase subunit beta/citryl-CoA lyase
MNAADALTWLFVPGDRPDRFGKAAASGADAIILDLEDAVAADAKASARQAVVDHLGAGNPGYVRINGWDTDEHLADVAALAPVGGALLGVMVPKAEYRCVFAAIDRALPAGVAAIALVETAAGLRAVDGIASAPRVARLAFGSADLMLESGIEDADRGLLMARSTLVFASLAARLSSPIDGITAALDDPAVVRRDARDGRRLGFGAKLCLHPAQIRPVLEGLAPEADEVRWARTVLDGASQANGHAVRVAGEMVDAPLLRRAERLWARHARLQETINDLEEN